MNSVLVVGNIHKDIYLRLDSEQCDAELDAQGTPWLDLGFNGKNYKFLNRDSVLSGAAITLEVLQNLNTKPKLLTQTDDKNQSCDYYRYILSVDDGFLYLAPDKCAKTKWKAPVEPVDWILIDQSAEIAAELVAGIKTYLSVSPKTKVAIFMDVKNQKNSINGKMSGHIQELIGLADVIFANSDLKPVNQQARVCVIKENEISLDEYRQNFSRQAATLLTDETLTMVIVATIFGSLINGASEKLALMLAKINAEHCQMGRSLNIEQLREHLAKWQKRQRDLKLLARSADEKILSSEKAVTIEEKKGTQKSEEVNRRLKNYYENGVRYLKWQCEFKLERIKTATNRKDLAPNQVEIEKKINELSGWIFKSQEYGLVPILELKLNLVGEVGIKTYHDTMVRVLDAAFIALEKSRVKVDSMVLMVKFDITEDEEEKMLMLKSDLTKETAEVLKHHVPSEIAGMLTPTVSAETD